MIRDDQDFEDKRRVSAERRVAAKRKRNKDRDEPSQPAIRGPTGSARNRQRDRATCPPWEAPERGDDSDRGYLTTGDSRSFSVGERLVVVEPSGTTRTVVKKRECGAGRKVPPRPMRSRDRHDKGHAPSSGTVLHVGRRQRTRTRNSYRTEKNGLREDCQPPALGRRSS